MLFRLPLLQDAPQGRRAWLPASQLRQQDQPGQTHSEGQERKQKEALMSVRLRTAEEKQVDAVTKALLHGTPDLVYLNSSICATCGIAMQMEMGKNQTAYYVHGRFPNPAVQQCVNADKVFLAEAIKLDVIDPGEYEKYGVEV